MELKIEQQQQLAHLLAKPSRVTQSDVPFLQALIATYPYYQPLYLLLAKASMDSASQQEALTKAALYNNGYILHKVIYEPQRLSPTQEVNIHHNPIWEKAMATGANDIVAASETVEAYKDEEVPFVENQAPLTNAIIEEEKPSLNVDAEVLDTASSTTTASPVPASDFPFPEIENIEPLQDEMIKVCEATVEVDDLPASENDEQETFEEISEVSIPADFVVRDVAQQENTIEVKTESVIEQANDENFDIETFAATDFFAFDLGANVAEDESIATSTSEEVLEENVTLTSEQAPENIVSKYDDDKLPFTFVWWLAKTRKNHEQIFRPYVSTSKTAASSQDLQQQYVEHIFHLQAPFELGNEQEQPATLQKNKKETEIIDSFIKNDPQIKALPPNQINTENKAKKSAEDGYDLVSETLAQIYIEQMLYHKAIDTYQKLSLKFPEKSRYFADLIQSLEKKI